MKHEHATSRYTTHLVKDRKEKRKAQRDMKKCRNEKEKAETDLHHMYASHVDKQICIAHIESKRIIKTLVEIDEDNINVKNQTCKITPIHEAHYGIVTQQKQVVEYLSNI